MIYGASQGFYPHDALEHLARFAIFGVRGWNNPRTVNEIYPLRECDVLPHFGFSWYRSDTTYFAGLKGIYNAGLANIWVANEAHADLFFIGVKLGELAKELNQGAFTK
jgi:hypothetical protein